VVSPLPVNDKRSNQFRRTDLDRHVEMFGGVAKLKDNQQLRETSGNDFYLGCVVAVYKLRNGSKNRYPRACSCCDPAFERFRTNFCKATASVNS
jgi:hypothetical protein